MSHHMGPSKHFPEPWICIPFLMRGAERDKEAQCLQRCHSSCRLVHLENWLHTSKRGAECHTFNLFYSKREEGEVISQAPFATVVMGKDLKETWALFSPYMQPCEKWKASCGFLGCVLQSGTLWQCAFQPICAVRMNSGCRKRTAGTQGPLFFKDESEKAFKIFFPPLLP